MSILTLPTPRLVCYNSTFPLYHSDLLLLFLHQSGDCRVDSSLGTSGYPKHLFKMRFDGLLASALYTSAALLSSVRAADDIDDGAEASSTSLSESSTSVPIEKPTFTVSGAIVYLSLCSFYSVP